MFWKKKNIPEEEPEDNDRFPEEKEQKDRFPEEEPPAPQDDSSSSVATGADPYDAIIATASAALSTYISSQTGGLVPMSMLDRAFTAAGTKVKDTISESSISVGDMLTARMEMLAVGGGGGHEGEYPSEGNLTEPQLMTRYTEALRNKDDDSSATYESGTREPDVANDDGERYRAESKNNDSVSPEIDSNEIPLAADDSITNARGGILGNNDKSEEYIDTREEVEDKPNDYKLDKYEGKHENIEAGSSASNPVKVDKSKHRIIAHNKHEASDIADNNNIDDNNEGGDSLSLRDSTAVRNGGVGVQKGEDNKENRALAAHRGSSSGSRYRNAPSVNTTIFVNHPQIVIISNKDYGIELSKLVTTSAKTSLIDVPVKWPTISVNNASYGYGVDTEVTEVTGYPSRDISSEIDEEPRRTSLYSVVPDFNKRGISRESKPRENAINYEIYPPVLASSAEDIHFGHASLISIDELDGVTSHRDSDLANDRRSSLRRNRISSAGKISWSPVEIEYGNDSLTSIDGREADIASDVYAVVVEEHAISIRRKRVSSTGSRHPFFYDIDYSNHSLTSSVSSREGRDIAVTADTDAAVSKYRTTSLQSVDTSSVGKISSTMSDIRYNNASLTSMGELEDDPSYREAEIAEDNATSQHRRSDSSTGTRGSSTDDINYSNAPLTSLTSSLSSIGERDIDVTIVTGTDAYMDAAVYKYGTTSQYRRSGSSTGNTSSYTNNTDNGKAPLTIRDERNTIDATKARDVDITNYKIIILHRKHSSSTGNRGLSERYQPNTIYSETNSKRLKVNVDVNIKGSLSLSDSEDKDDFKK